MANTQNIQVVAMALYNPHRNCYLILQRAKDQSGAGLWEFPGGKVEEGESLVGALVREIKEELGILIREEELKFVALNTHAYPNKTIDLHLYKIVKAVETFNLVDHDDYAWIDSQTVKQYDLSAADIPFLEKLF